MVVISQNCSHVLLIGANHITQINLALKVNCLISKTLSVRLCVDSMHKNEDRKREDKNSSTNMRDSGVSNESKSH